MRVRLGDRERDGADAASDVDDDGVAREVFPREACVSHGQQQSLIGNLKEGLWCNSKEGDAAGERRYGRGR